MKDRTIPADLKDSMLEGQDAREKEKSEQMKESTHEQD